MAKRYSARREACEESKVGRAPASSLRSAGLRSGAGGVRLSAASPRPDHRACGLSAPIRHAKCKPPKIVNDNSPSVGLRLGSMLLDHFILCFVLVPLWKIIDLASGSNEAFETPVWPFYVIVDLSEQGCRWGTKPGKAHTRPASGRWEDRPTCERVPMLSQEHDHTCLANRSRRRTLLAHTQDRGYHRRNSNRCW